jgi:Holliday junction resolvase RusA-like endonuclease
MDYGWETIRGTTPSKSNCYRIIKIGRISKLGKTDALEAYENSFYIQCSGKYRNLKIKGYFEYYCRVYYPSQRSDLDNSLKVQLDCLQHTKTIVNDNKCVKIVAEKFVDPDNPRVEFKIVTIDHKKD